MITPGTPANEKPATSNGQASLLGLQCRSTWYQMDGIWIPRCGSLARKGSPVVVRLPETAHELEPMPSPCGPRAPSSRATLLRATASASVGTTAGWAEAGPGLAPAVPPVPILLTITGWSAG